MRLAAGTCLVLAAACADGAPTGAANRHPEPRGLAAFRCTITPGAATAHCAPPSLNAGGALGNIVVDGDGPHVAVVMSQVSQANGMARMNVAVRNLTSKVMAFDGTRATAVFVYMRTPPSNGVAWTNPRGTATFEADAAKPYQKYSGSLLGGDGVLSPNELTSSRDFSFALNGATSFTLDLMVATNVPDRFGDVVAAPDSVVTAQGRSDALAAQARDPFGVVLPGAPLRWTSRNPALLPVDASTGVVSPTGPGQGWVVVAHAADRGFAVDSVFVRANPAGPFSASIVSGDGQPSAAGQPLVDSLRVRVTDSGGGPLAGIAVQWRVLGTSGGAVRPAIAVTDANGVASASWRVGTAAGADSVEAAAPSQLSRNRLVFFSSPATQGYTRTWTGAVSDAWDTAGNWSPAGAPTPLDTVVVPAVARLPRLAGNRQVRRLVVNSGSVLTVDGATLSVRSDALVAGEVAGTGIVRLNGDYTSISRDPTLGRVARFTGRFAALDIAVGDSVQPRVLANVTVARDLRMMSPGKNLYLAGMDLLVQGDMYLQGGGVGAGSGHTVTADTLNVRGNLLVMPGGAFLPARGTLRLGGDVVQTGGSFRTNTNHVLVLDGPAQQRVHLVDSREGTSTSLVVNLRVFNTGGLRVDRNLHVVSLVSNGAPIVGSDTLSTRNRLQTSGPVQLPAVSVSTNGLAGPYGGACCQAHLSGGAATFDVGGVYLHDVVAPPLPYRDLAVGDVTAGGPLHISGDLLVRGRFVTNGHPVTVQGNVTIAPGGTVVGTITEQ
jgi:hypothetical protein